MSRSPEAKTPRTRDAVLIVPGIMGSELFDRESQRVVWGLADLGWYVAAWAKGTGLGPLYLTEDERAGRYGRIEATGLLEFPAFAPLVRGLEPYHDLVKGVRAVVLDPAAVRCFPYDWRLPVSYNAARLAEAAHRHLTAWRRHPLQRAARRLDADDRDARLVIVAHSMGGLLARQLSTIPGATDGVRATITLGTPFFGSVKAAMMLNSGRGGPPLRLPRQRLRALAATLPGVYDLLPAYRCLDEGRTARRLTPGDIGRLGGDPALARDALPWRSSDAGPVPVNHTQVVGAHQPTAQSLTLRDGRLKAVRYTCKPTADGSIERVDYGGDGTVHRESAQLPGASAVPLAQSHGALAKTPEAVLLVTDALTDQRTGPWLGEGEVGIDLPDIVAPDATFTVRITGVDHPRDVRCEILDAATDRLLATPPVVRADGGCCARVSLPEEGLYRVAVTGGGASGVSQIVMAGAGGND